MSLCPRRLLLSRFRPGLPSYLPQLQRSVKVHHQERKPLGARYLTEYAAQSNTAVPDEVQQDLRISEDTLANLWEGTTSAGSATRGSSDFVTSKIRSHSAQGDGVLHEEIGKIFYRVPTTNGKVQIRVRNVSREMRAKEMAVRSKTLFHDEADLGEWRAARTRITKARFSGGDIAKDLVPSDLSETEQTLLDKLKMDPGVAFREAWGTIKKDRKGALWQRLALWLLHRSPELVPDFLRITCQSPQKPLFVFIRDCIFFLIRFFPDLVDRSLITTCLHPDAWPVLFLPQKGARLYLNGADRDGVYYAWRLAKEKRTHMTAETYLCFMKRFTEFGDVDRALEALERSQHLKEPLFRANSESVIRHCCKLLTLDSVVDDGSVRNFHILPRLLQVGIEPTRDLMNVVLSNAFRTGDSDVGHTVLEYMKEHEMDPDSFTYLTLLKDAVASGDRHRLQSLLEEIQPKEELHKNPYISSKILHSHFVYTAKTVTFDEDPNEVFYSMLGMYNQLHDITPLKELMIIPQHYTPPPGSGTTPPSVVALFIMIATYLRCLQRFEIVSTVYHRFRTLVLQGHEVIAPLAATDHTYNEFLIAFRRDPRGLRSAVHVVEDMLHTVSDGDRAKHLKERGIQHVQPSVRTWTLLMSVFVYNKQPLAVEKVRAMMDKHEVQYSQQTWNMIINNYANSQNVIGIAQSIKQMEREGFVVDEHTVKSLRYLREPERLWIAVEELDKSSEQQYDEAYDEDYDEESDEAHVRNSMLSNKGHEQGVASLIDQGLQRLKDRMKWQA
ncbi:hypothetical protein BJX61DRAFT_488447 [Aspergillus egyptiacus]|nr:hypothetical protein BJX61DRAFT_488447 [Aspergillus egyptiacus]